VTSAKCLGAGREQSGKCPERGANTAGSGQERGGIRGRMRGTRGKMGGMGSQDRVHSGLNRGTSTEVNPGRLGQWREGQRASGSQQPSAFSLQPSACSL